MAKRNTSLAKVDSQQKSKAIFAGAMGLQTLNEEQINNQILIQKCAEMFSVPPNGVDILGGKPYLNKVGLIYKLHGYYDGTSKNRPKLKGIKVEFLAQALKLDDTAIVKATIEMTDGSYYEAIGEASKHNINARMDKVAKSINMMADTRARNRAMWEAIAPLLFDEVMKKLTKTAMKNDPHRPIMEAALKSTAEEMDGATPQKAAPQATDEAGVRDAIVKAIERAKKPETLKQYREKVEQSDKLSKQSKQMLLGMIDGKMKGL